MASITKKQNGTFLVRISRGVGPEGKQIIHSKVFKPSSNRLSYSKLQKELDSFVNQFEEEIDSGNSVGPKNGMTFAEFIPEYLQIKKGTIAPTTFAFYQNIIETELISKFGPIKLRDIRVQHIQSFIQYLCNEMPRKDGVDGHVKPQTVKRYTTVLRSVLSLAYKMEYIDDDVGQSKRITFPKEISPEIEVFSPEEIAELLKALESEPLHIRALIETALFTGCRRGEVVGLKWSDIDFDKRTVSIKRSIYKPHGEKALEKLPKSTSSIRTIAIPERLCETLTLYKKHQDCHKSYLGDAWNELDYVFTEEYGFVMNPQSPTKIFDHFLKRHNLRHLKFHGLRHTSATMLLSNGCDIKTVSARLGHADIETTGIYVHALKSSDYAAAAKFDELIGKSTSNGNKR